ncbi:alpha/beta hydrolase [Streptomyces sp. TG1A-8]|uniref:alpha/beta fold hydrolase n=1 Tax=Streptomyces sp. TG1A-8 TaxID=3051385 RepID=UPI00265BCFB2|nr:alpha/beta hydrolase [Streptomyces sp. TG1A-8]MDO0925730.1 alpha/beta hydrolase [Streptomyces sp. TG1A-8]
MPRPEGPSVSPVHDRVGTTTLVRSAGTGRVDGPDGALVLVPGLGAPGYLLRTLERCARRGPVRVLDVPGFGDPAGPACSETLGALAGTVARWLVTVPRAPVVLAGHSTGAQVALHAAVRVPERVRALVLLAPTFPPRLRRTGPLVSAFLRTAVRESPSVVPTVLPSYLKAGPRRLVNCIRSAQADAPEDLLPAVTCPVTVVAGEDDALCPPEWIDLLARRAGRGRALVVPGAHSFPHRYPALTARLLAEAGEA